LGFFIFYFAVAEAALLLCCSVPDSEDVQLPYVAALQREKVV
jgi:hypothetical protein